MEVSPINSAVVGLWATGAAISSLLSATMFLRAHRLFKGGSSFKQFCAIPISLGATASALAAVTSCWAIAVGALGNSPNKANESRDQRSWEDEIKKTFRTENEHLREFDVGLPLLLGPFAAFIGIFSPLILVGYIYYKSR